MIQGANEAREVPVVPAPRQFLGQVIRQQGRSGTVAVVAALTDDGVEVIPNPKRLFPRDGIVEVNGSASCAGLSPGDWVRFDVVKNTRFRTPEYRALHLTRIPRFAALAESTMPIYRNLLVRDGWSGDSRAGLWALRLGQGDVVVGELEQGKDGRLRLTKDSARQVNTFVYKDSGVVRLGTGSRSDEIFIATQDEEYRSLDWSSDVDYILAVVSSLGALKEARLLEIANTLEIHGNLSRQVGELATEGQEPTVDSLRSHALATRLRADQQLMETYIAAAVQDEAVRQAVSEYVKDGYYAEQSRMRVGLQAELAAERGSQLSQLSEEVALLRSEALTELELDLEAMRASGRERLELTLREIDQESARHRELAEQAYSSRSSALDLELAEQSRKVEGVRVELDAIMLRLEQTQDECEQAQQRLSQCNLEIDRSLAIAELVRPANPSSTASSEKADSVRIAVSYPIRPTVSSKVKAALIARSLMLTEEGVALLQFLAALLLSGEIPILVGKNSIDVLRVVESTLCPGRYSSIEADPTLISIEDLWARPGSGLPTTLALASREVSKGGASLVVIRAVERSGARFWVRSLSDSMRGGALPRGLFVCGTIEQPHHEELSALPTGTLVIHVGEVFKPGTRAASATILQPPLFAHEVIDPGTPPSDLSIATPVVLEAGADGSLESSLRIARIFAEAMEMFEDDSLARSIALRAAGIMLKMPAV